jgi:hypothetical protein
LQKVEKKGIKKAMQNKLVVKEENDFKQFWNKILIQIYQKNTRQNQFIQ